nr:hypothetical protein [Tanacetum cinerariifolium]
APKPKASARKKKGGSASSTTPLTPIATLTPTTTVAAALRLSAATKGKQPARATSPTDPSDVKRTEAKQLKIVLKKSRHETHISQQGGSSTDEGTGLRMSEEERMVFRFKDRVKLLEVNFSNIPDTYGESAILKRRRKEDDDQEGPSAGSDRGSKRRRKGGEHASASTSSEQATGSAGMSITGTQSRQLSASESAFAEEPVQTTCQMEEPSHPVFEIGAEDQPLIQTSQRPPTSDRDWNKTLPAAQGNAQSWISALAKQTDARSSFNELLDTPIDFSNFIMNRLDVDTLTPELLAGPTYELMMGS